MAPTSMPKEVTSSTPQGIFAPERPFMGPEYLSRIAHEDAYIARTAVSNPLQIEEYMKKAILHQKGKKGFSFVEILAYCPTNWKTNARDTVAFLEKMKQSYPLGEIMG